MLYTLFNWSRCMAKWISNSLPTTSFPCMLPTNLTFGRNLMLSLSVGRLPIPADILEGQNVFTETRLYSSRKWSWFREANVAEGLRYKNFVSNIAFCVWLSNFHFCAFPSFPFFIAHSPYPLQVCASLRTAYRKRFRIICVLVCESLQLSNEFWVGVVTS